METVQDRKYRYFIIPRFNQRYNVEKIETLPVSKISTIHGRYVENNENNSSFCCFLLYTNKEYTESEIRDSLKPICTSKTYVKIDGIECKSTRLFFLSTYHAHKNKAGLKNLLNTFAKNNYELKPVNGNSENCMYWILDFRSILSANHAMNFCSQIPFENESSDQKSSRIFISENPFDIPLVQIQGISSIQNYFGKIPDFENFHLDYNLDRSCFKLKPESSLVLAENVRFSNYIINKINYTKYKSHTIVAQYYLPDFYSSFLYCFLVKVRANEPFNNCRDFFSEMMKIGPVYQVMSGKDGKNFFVVFKSRKSLRKIFNDNKYTVSFASCAIFSIYNFPPNTNESNLATYFQEKNIKYIAIEKCNSTNNILAHFHVCVDYRQEKEFQDFFNNENCIYQNKTRPFCVKYLFEQEYETLCERLVNKDDTIQISPQNTRAINDVFNEYSQMGCINLLFLNPETHRYSITFNTHDQYLKAKKYMDKNSQQVLVEKEKSISETKKKGGKISIEIKKTSTLDMKLLISSDDSDQVDEIKDMDEVIAIANERGIKKKKKDKKILSKSTNNVYKTVKTKKKKAKAETSSDDEVIFVPQKSNLYPDYHFSSSDEKPEKNVGKRKAYSDRPRKRKIDKSKLNKNEQKEDENIEKKSSDSLRNNDKKQKSEKLKNSSSDEFFIPQKSKQKRDPIKKSNISSDDDEELEFSPKPSKSQNKTSKLENKKERNDDLPQKAINIELPKKVINIEKPKKDLKSFSISKSNEKIFLPQKNTEKATKSFSIVEENDVDDDDDDEPFIPHIKTDIQLKTKNSNIKEKNDKIYIPQNIKKYRDPIKKSSHLNDDDDDDFVQKKPIMKSSNKQNKNAIKNSKVTVNKPKTHIDIDDDDDIFDIDDDENDNYFGDDDDENGNYFGDDDNENGNYFDDDDENDNYFGDDDENDNYFGNDDENDDDDDDFENDNDFDDDDY